MPTAELAKSLGIKLDESGFIIVDDKRETSIKGVFAAGDVTNGAHKILVTAYADGAIAGLSASKHTCDATGKDFQQHLY